MTGPDEALESSKGKTRPLITSQVFLFNMNKLVSELKVRGVKIGIATIIRKLAWESAMIYPVQRNSELIMNETQMERLSLFGKPHTRTCINSIERGVDENTFTKVCEIRPILEKDGTIYIEKPYLRYRNTKNLELQVRVRAFARAQWRYYGGLGYLLSREVIDPDTVYEMSGNSSILLWGHFESVIRGFRERDSRPENWRWFEYLADEMKRVRDERGLGTYVPRARSLQTPILERSSLNSYYRFNM